MAVTTIIVGALKVNDKLFEAIAAVPWIPEPDGGAVTMQLTHSLKATRFQPLSLSNEKPVSQFAFHK